MGNIEVPHSHTEQRELEPGRPIIVCKYGTSSLVDSRVPVPSRGMPFHEIPFKEHVMELALSQKLKLPQARFIYVISGAVETGRYRVGFPRSSDETLETKRMLAGVGQPLLMRKFDGVVEKHGLVSSQFLLTDHILHDTEAILEDTLNNDVVPFINANDATYSREMQSYVRHASDNDRQARLVATAVNAHALYYFTGSWGYLNDRHETIHEFDHLDRFHFNGISEGGRGGMKSKVVEATRASHRGIRTYIANAEDPDIVLRSLRGEQGRYTIFSPKNQST